MCYKSVEQVWAAAVAVVEGVVEIAVVGRLADRWEVSVTAEDGYC